MNMLVEEIKQTLPKTGFYFKSNAILRKKIWGLNIVLLLFLLFTGIAGVNDNPFLAIYTFAKWVIFFNLFSLLILSLYDNTSIPLLLKEKSLQKEIITRRIKFIFLNSMLLFLIESIVALLNYFLHIPEFLNEHSNSYTEILYYIPSTSEYCLLILIGICSFLTAYMGNYLLIRYFYQIEKTESFSGRFSFQKKEALYYVLGILSFVVIGMTTYGLSLGFAENINQTYLLYIDGGIIVFLCFIFWQFGYRYLKQHNFNFPIESSTDLSESVEINKQF